MLMLTYRWVPKTVTATSIRKHPVVDLLCTFYLCGLSAISDDWPMQHSIVINAGHSTPEPRIILTTIAIHVQNALIVIIFIYINADLGLPIIPHSTESLFQLRVWIELMVIIGICFASNPFYTSPGYSAKFFKFWFIFASSYVFSQFSMRD